MCGSSSPTTINSRRDRRGGGGGGAPPPRPAAFGHTGFTGASLFVDPERGRVCVLLTNRLHPDARGVDMNAFRRRFHEIAAAL